MYLLRSKKGDEHYYLVYLILAVVGLLLVVGVILFLQGKRTGILTKLGETLGVS